MIDVCQWRASIGSWNCCQAATGPRSRYESDGESLPTRNCTSGRDKAPVFQASAVDLISFIVFFILSLCASRLTPTGHCISFQLLVDDDISGWLQLYVGASIVGSFNLFTVSFHLYFYFLLILLSGDVELNPGPETDKPDAPSLLCSASAELTQPISTTLYTVTDLLHAKRLIPLDTKREMYFKGETNEKKAGRLLITLETLLKASLNPEQYLINVCYILLSQKLDVLTEITVPILNQLGESIPDDHNITIILPPDDVQKYADALKQKYKDQPIVATEWPPRVGKDFFGRLTLIEGQDLDKKTADQRNWHMLRGQIDEIPNTLGSKGTIKIENLLKIGSSQIPKILVDGPPGIGKTTLCRKLLNMWSNEVFDCQYDLVLFCPLRNIKVAKAKELKDLFVYRTTSDRERKVVEWMSENEGKGVFIIFDGWDELSDKLKKSSLAASIIRNEMLAFCSVVVTSRSYASASLSALPSINRYIQIIGFSVEEISTVVIKTLQNDPTLADNLIDENKCNSILNSFFKTTQNSKNSQLAVKLVNDLKVRGDVQSLCYIPMVCSMVILVYWKEGGQLPTTLTQLYENFILQTIKKDIKRKQPEADTRYIVSLDDLPLELPSLFKNLCQLAYTNLAATRLTFSLQQSNQFLTEAAKEDYLGLLTKFRECDEEKYQFLHLSIQEFLAAWWIVKYDNTETKFNNYFHNEHFKMCLRFVAGLTHLEHESYQQYFNRGIDLQCKKNPLRKFETSHNHWFYKYLNSDTGILDYDYQIRIINLEDLEVLLLQLLYESQNTELCQLFAQSMKGNSLCLMCNSDRQVDFIKLGLFDWLCLGYFISSSGIKWNQLDLGKVREQSLSVFKTGLSGTSQSQCTKMILHLQGNSNATLALNFLNKPLLQNIQQLIFKCSQCDTGLVLMQLFNLPQLKMLHLTCTFDTDLDETSYASKCTELEQCIKRNLKVQELIIIQTINTKCKLLELFITSLIRGITQNRMITSFTLEQIDSIRSNHLVTGSMLESLLKENSTLQALSMNIPNHCISLSVNEVKEMSRLTALEISGSILMNSLLPCIEGLKCLILPLPYSPCLIFKSHPNLQQLTLQLDTAKSINDFFTNLQTNTTLRALRVEVKEGSVYTICSIGRHHCYSSDYVHSNTDYKKCMSASSYMSIITTGIMLNTGLQQLSIPVFLPITNKEIKEFLTVIFQKHNITELEIHFQLDQTYYFQNDEKK
uniref:NACHT domain-containing protein n=1 Tax=Amphimedon queenslandica TaxID=400682 RepID=A0A1X7TFX7_AMPQE